MAVTLLCGMQREKRVLIHKESITQSQSFLSLNSSLQSKKKEKQQQSKSKWHRVTVSTEHICDASHKKHNLFLRHRDDSGSSASSPVAAEASHRRAPSYAPLVLSLSFHSPFTLLSPLSSTLWCCLWCCLSWQPLHERATCHLQWPSWSPTPNV